MPDTWGTTPKSQIDPEKIEAAIVRLIKEHSEDPEAHLDEGGSIQAHKQSEIIDHLAHSFVADKISDSQYFYRSGNLPMEGLHTEMGAVYHSYPNSWFEVSPGEGTFHKSSFGSSPFVHWLDYSKEIIFGWSGYMIATSDLDFAVFCGNYEEGITSAFDMENGFGFWAESSVIYAFYCSATGIVRIPLDDVEKDQPHMYRAESDPEKGEIRFRVDGEHLATIPLTNIPAPTSSYLLEVIMKNHQQFAGYLSLGDFFLSIK